MNKICVYLITYIFIIHTSLFAYSTDPKEFVSELVTEVISKLSDKNLTDDEKAKFVEEIALENVDIKALSLYTLGEIRKSDKQIWYIKILLKNIFKKLNFKVVRLFE